MKRSMLFLLLCLLMAACGSPLPTSPPQSTPSPDLRPTPDDGQEQAEPTPVIGPFTPADLPLQPLAWGAPTDGKSGAGPEAHLLRPADDLEETWITALPAQAQQELKDLAASRLEDGKAWLVILYGGMQPCPAYHVSVLSADLVQRKLQIHWQVLPPEPNTGCAAVQAYPYLILSLSDPTQLVDEVEFVLNGIAGH